MKRYLLGLASAAALALGAPAAHAGAISYAVSVWNVQTTTNRSITDASQQALPTNPLISSGNLAATFNYTGDVNMQEESQADNKIGLFINSGGPLVSDLTFFNGADANTILSTATFATTSIFEFTFHTSTGLVGTIDHDDGISLFAHGDTTGNLLPVGDSAPTTIAPSAVDIGPGTYDLWYVEANGAPADLITSLTETHSGLPSVPEPLTLTVLAIGLTGLAAARRRRAS